MANTKNYPQKEKTENFLDNLLKNRFHGAANIRGIRYQILYTTLRAFDLFGENGSYHVIRPEGIEDLDLLGISVSNEYIQVKYSKEPWNWAKLKEPLKNFIQIYKEDPNHLFVLVVNFELKKEAPQKKSWVGAI